MTELDYNDYDLTVTDAGWYRPEDGKWIDSYYETNPNYFSTNKVKIKNNSLKLHDVDFMHLLFWDKNGGYIGYFNNLLYSTYETAKFIDYLLTPDDFELPANAYSFAITGTLGSASDLNADVGISDFRSYNADYNYYPLDESATLPALFDYTFDLSGNANVGTAFNTKESPGVYVWYCSFDPVMTDYNVNGVTITYAVNRQSMFSISPEDMPLITGHKYFFGFQIIDDDWTGTYDILGELSGSLVHDTEYNVFYFETYGSTSVRNIALINGSGSITFNSLFVVDLTAIFGQGYEPTTQHFIDYYWGEASVSTSPSVTGSTLESHQLATNGDFSDGTTGWNVAAGSISAFDNIVIWDYVQSSNTAIFWRPLNVLENNKYYTSLIVEERINMDDNQYLTTQFAGVTNQGTGITKFDLGLYSAITTSLYDNTLFRIRLYGIDESATIKFSHVNVFNISTLITNNQYSPLYSTTFDLMTDAQIKTQMDAWVADGLDTVVYALGDYSWQSINDLDYWIELNGDFDDTFKIPDLDMEYYDWFFDYTESEQEYLLKLWHDHQTSTIRVEWFDAPWQLYDGGLSFTQLNSLADIFYDQYSIITYSNFDDVVEDGKVTFDYTVYPPAPPVEDDIENFTDSLGLGDFARPLIVSAVVIILLVMTFLLSHGFAPWFVYIIEIVGIFLLATIFGWIPAWLIMGVGSIMMFITFFKLKSGTSDES
jgi:hypothetical protein